MLVNWDHHEAEPDRIAASLAKAGLGGVQSLALSNGFEEKLRFAVDPKWMGDLPSYATHCQRWLGDGVLG